MNYKLKISCSKNHLKEIRAFVSEILHQHNFPDEDSAKVILAVDEICANMIIHSNHCNPAETLQLRVQYLKQEKIIFEIKDKGEGFDMKGYQEPSLEELIQTRRKGGIGLMLVKKIMDKIEFTHAKGENICRLEKNL